MTLIRPISRQPLTTVPRRALARARTAHLKGRGAHHIVRGKQQVLVVQLFGKGDSTLAGFLDRGAMVDDLPEHARLEHPGEPEPLPATGQLRPAPRPHECVLVIARTGPGKTGPYRGRTEGRWRPGPGRGLPGDAPMPPGHRRRVSPPPAPPTAPSPGRQPPERMPAPSPRPGRARRGGPAARRARPAGSAYSRSIASTIRACSARRRSWSRLPYATLVGQCLKVYSRSGNRLIG